MERKLSSCVCAAVDGCGVFFPTRRQISCSMCPGRWRRASGALRSVIGRRARGTCLGTRDRNDGSQRCGQDALESGTCQESHICKREMAIFPVVPCSHAVKGRRPLSQRLSLAASSRFYSGPRQLDDPAGRGSGGASEPVGKTWKQRLRGLGHSPSSHRPHSLPTSRPQLARPLQISQR